MLYQTGSLNGTEELMPVTLGIRAGAVWDLNPVLSTLDFYNGACVIGFFSEELYALPKGIAKFDDDSIINDEVTFAWVLNLPETEVLWPGEAADLFFPELFAVAPDGMVPYVMDSYLAEHQRCEILRMSNELGLSTLDEMEQDVQLFIMMESAFLSIETDEEDTLNSELLLTQVYVPPQDVPTSWKTPPTTTDLPSKLPGACNPTAGSTPTEKED